PEHHGWLLAETADYRAAFDASPVRIDWDTGWVRPEIAGCWRGHTWEDLRTREEVNFDRFLRARDFDGLEAYFRALCRRFRGEALTDQIGAVPFEGYTAGVENTLRQLAIPDQTAAVLLSARGPAGSPTEGFLMTRFKAGEDFAPHGQRAGEILGQ